MTNCTATLSLALTETDSFIVTFINSTKSHLLLLCSRKLSRGEQRIHDLSIYCLQICSAVLAVLSRHAPYERIHPGHAVPVG